LAFYVGSKSNTVRSFIFWLDEETQQFFIKFTRFVTQEVMITLLTAQE